MGITLSPETLSITIGAVIFFVLAGIVLGRKRKISISERIILDKEKLMVDSMIKAAEIEGNVNAKEQKRSWFEKKELDLKRSGSGVVLPLYIGIAAFSGAAIFAIVQQLTQIAPLAVAFSFIGLLLPDMYVKSRVNKNLRFFNQHFVKALRRMAASMRAGSSVTQAIGDVVNTRIIHPVIRAEMKKVLVDIEYGANIEEAFYKLYERTGSADAKHLAITIEIKRLHGGGIGQTFEQIGATISSRTLMEADIRATLAQVNATSMLLSGIPFVLTIILMVISPGYFDPLLETTMGRLVFLFCYVFIILGGVIMKKMSNIKL